MQYRIAYSDTPDGLDKLVNNAINDGFEPLGGVAVAHAGRTTPTKNDKGEEIVLEHMYFVQALTKASKNAFGPINSK